MIRDLQWTEMGLRAVTLGREFSRARLPESNPRRLVRILVPDEQGSLVREFLAQASDESRS
jgi:hypothetical protein